MAEGDGIEVKISPEKVEKAVTDAVLKSGIGKHLEEAIHKAVVDFHTPFDSPLKKAVSQCVHEEILKLLRTDYADKIKAAIKAKLTDQVIDDVTEAAWDALLEATRSRNR